LRCAAAFLTLSAYIWLFGIVGVIEDAGAIAYADDSPELVPPESSLGENGEEGFETKLLPSGDVADTSNEPKPGFADFPAPPPPVNNPPTTPDTNGPNNDTPPNNPPQDNPPHVNPSDTSTTTTTTTTSTTTTTTNNETSVNPGLNDRVTVTTPNGDVTDTVLNIISRIVQLEISSSFHVEAIKAQAIAAYTYVMLPASRGGTARVELAPTPHQRVIDNVKEVLGLALYFNGDYIQAVYGASSAGYTKSAVNAWGADFPYLRTQRTEFDEKFDPNFGLSNQIAANDIKIAILEKTGIELTGNPANWLRINSRVDTVYVGSMTIGGRNSYTSNGREIAFTGKVFRDIMGTRVIRSPAFEDPVYNPTTDRFTFVTYGYGHGVGLSQNGANILAREYGYDYKQILEFYYPGTILR